MFSTHFVDRSVAELAGFPKLEYRVADLRDKRRSAVIRLQPIYAVAIAVSAFALTLAVAGSRVGLAQVGSDVVEATPVSTQLSEQPATDSLGDPLPAGARLRLGTLRFRHPSSAIELALSPDEKTIVTIGRRELIVWDVATGKELWRVDPSEHGISLPGAAYGIRAIAFTSDSSRFYTPGRHNQVIAWEVSSGRPKVLSFDLANQPVRARFGATKAVDVTRDGHKLAIGSSHGVAVCNDKGEVQFEVANQPDGPVQVDDMNRDRLTFAGHYSFGQFSPDEKLLAVVTSDSPEEIRLLDSVTGEELRCIDLTSWLVRLSFSPDSKQIVATERDSAVRLYAVESGKEIWAHKIKLTNKAESYTSAVAYSPDAKIIAACAPIGSDYLIYLLDAATGQDVGILTGHTWKPWCVAFTADSRILYSSGWDGSIRRWDVGARQQLALPKGFRATGVCTTSPDGQTLAYADDTGVIRLVDAKDGTQLQTLRMLGSDCSRLAFSSDGRDLAAGGASSDQVHVAVWDLSNGQVVHRWDWPKGRDPHCHVESLCFTPDGKRLAAAVFRQSAACLWDMTTGQQIAQLTHGEIYGLSFSPDSKTLATAGWDKVVRLWEADTGKLKREFNVEDEIGKDGDMRMYTVCFAPKGGLIATAHLSGKVRIWDAADMTLRSTFQIEGRFIHGAINFSPDGSRLATGSMSGNVALWDPLAAEKIRDIGRHQSYVYRVSFGRDSRTLLSGGNDGVCYLWDLPPNETRPDIDLDR